MTDQARIKKLGDLMAEVSSAIPVDMVNLTVSGITADSRQVTPGMLFVAVSGDKSDGHHYIQEAVRRGCVAVLAEYVPSDDCDVHLITVPDTRSAMGHLAAAFYDFPAREMTMIAITGTNGKTTSSYILENLIRHAGGIPGVVGTINVRYLDVTLEAVLTTPEAMDIQQQLRLMADNGVTHVVMEVSSHGLEQERVNAIFFDVALFTNLSRDHLDFHGSMENYFAAKKILFARHMKDTGTAVVVLSQSETGDWGKRLVEFLSANTHLKLVTCGIGYGDVRALTYSFSLEGISAEINSNDTVFSIQTPLVGAFNLENVLGCIACGLVLGYGMESMQPALASLDSIPGRLEKVKVAKEDNEPVLRDVFVDYAHTPEALQHVLQTIRSLNPDRLIVVFGCGGDRDKGKRPLMGEVAGRLSDVCLVTSDNPRSESPNEILNDIERGLQEISAVRIDSNRLGRDPDLKGYDIIESRREAIKRAIEVSRPGDVIVICGKGHESYQIERSGRIFFDDRQEARKQLERIREAA
jgi:UDP-N-acetylmuramyl-tripeptide synthetase